MKPGSLELLNRKLPLQNQRFKWWEHVTICIHNFIHCGDTLYLDCPVLGINDHPLKSKEIFECVPEAKEIIKQKLNKLTTLFDDFYKDEHIELTRY